MVAMVLLDTDTVGSCTFNPMLLIGTPDILIACTPHDVTIQENADVLRWSCGSFLMAIC